MGPDSTDEDSAEESATDGGTPYGERRERAFDMGKAGFMVDTRERLAGVEQRQQDFNDQLDRIEGKVDDVAETAEHIEASAAKADVLHDEIAPEVEKNTRVRTIARWVGLMALGLSGLAGTLVGAGVIL